MNYFLDILSLFFPYSIKVCIDVTAVAGKHTLFQDAHYLKPRAALVSSIDHPHQQWYSGQLHWSNPNLVIPKLSISQDVVC